MGGQVDTWEMPLVHRAFRSAFRTAPAWVTSVTVGDRERSEFVAQHLSMVVTGLHEHHTTEDELLWPVLLPRAAMHTELVHRMESQHKQLQVHLDRVTDLLPGWRATADAVTGRELAGVFTAATAVLEEHLAEEEREILPLVAEHLTQAEWQTLGDRGKASIPKGKAGFIALGEILADATLEERTAFLTMVPAPIRLIWRMLGHRIHEHHKTRLYEGIPTPHPTGHL